MVKKVKSGIIYLIDNMQEDKFEFNKQKHHYTLNGHRLYGVTTVLGVINKPALIQWASNLATARAFTFGAKPEIAQEIAKHDYIDGSVAKNIGAKFPEFEEARLAHKKKASESADKGTDIHSTIEEIIKVSIADFGGYTYLDTHEEPQVQQFLSWARENNIRFLDSEKKLYSKTLWVAGTMDLFFMKDNKFFVGDIKTTGAIWDRTPFFQCGAYQLMLEEMNPTVEIAGRCIVRLDKNGSIEVMYSYSPLDKEGFLHALGLFKALEAPISQKQKIIKKAINKKKHA